MESNKSKEVSGKEIGRDPKRRYRKLTCIACNEDRYVETRQHPKYCSNCWHRDRFNKVSSKLEKRRPDQTGERNQNWKGGQWIDPNSGYRYLSLTKDDPYNVMTKRSGRYIVEHRYIMAMHLGRPLKRYETVHHKNGIRADNRIENLELWASRHPSGVRIEDWTIDGLREEIKRLSLILERKLNESSIKTSTNNST